MSRDYAAMSDDEVIALFTDITLQKSGISKAANKPLLLLMALAALQRNDSPQLSYVEIERPLTDLLHRFGRRPTRSPNPHQPFWRLRNDGDGAVWQVSHASELMRTLTKSGDVRVGELRRLHATGGPPPELATRLRGQPELVNRIAARLLGDHFFESDHEDLLDALGFPWVVTSNPSKPRDPAFRREVLRIYQGRCAICAYDGRLELTRLGLEAAHVQARFAGGPDSPDNGMALCVLHHRAYDRGAISMSEDGRVLVSEHLEGGSMVDALLVQYANRMMARPLAGHPKPRPKFAAWHRREVFRGPARG